MKGISISIIGNSVGLKCRPPSDILNYGCLLKKEGYLVNNLSFGRATTDEVVILKDSYIRTYPEFFVINLGCVDAPSREIPLWFSDLLYGRRKMFGSSILKFIFRAFISKNRSLFTNLRFRKSWISKRKFLDNVNLLTNYIQRNTNAKIIVLGINNGSERIERKLPGTIAKYIDYNLALKDLIIKKNISFIDVSDLSNQLHFPDGVHYNAEGHKIIANRLRKELLNLSK